MRTKSVEKLYVSVKGYFFLICLFACLTAYGQRLSQTEMQRIYDEVRTPYKYGMVVAPADNYHKIDCPTVFRIGGRWYMTYVVYNGKDGLDGRGYETWMAVSDDLLHWKTTGRILSYKNDGWDMNQRGGFPALIDWTWGGSYDIMPFKKKYWMTYIGGHGTGYEAVREPLNIGLAWTEGDPSEAHEWQSDDKPLLSITDKDVQWWEKLTQYKSTIYQIKDVKANKKSLLPKELAKYRFMMFYNAGGVNPANDLKAERIGIALSNDLKKWRRYRGNPVYSHEAPGIITGDAQIVKMNLSTSSVGRKKGRGEAPLYVMFYFSAYNPARKYNAYNTFAVSRDLIHWQDWNGQDLIVPSKPYDEMFAHKSYVVKHDGVVYHFYCAVNNDQQRGIAVATSVPMGRSEVKFPAPEQKGRRNITSLNDGWTGAVHGEKPVAITIPHNFDDYYGYRQLRHGNLHGKATYNKTFNTKKLEGKRYFLQFEGVGTYATVTLNGHKYPEELVGRTVWTLDVTDHLKDGRNELKVAVEHPAMQTASPWVCGGCSSEWGFSEGSQPFGIFRPVSLIETDAVRIEPFGVHIWNNAACDSVFVETEVHNYTKLTQTVEVVNKFTLASGKQVFRHAEPLTLKAGETKTLRHAEHVADVHRWSIEDPYLYSLATMLKRDNKTIDEVTTPFGIRSISWPVLRARMASADSIPADDRRFFLNGQPVFINGTCEYDHLFGGSHAFSPEQIRSRVKQISNAGFNALREAHQPHNLLYQRLCDEKGILFWSQFSAHIWYDTSKFRRNFKNLLVRWIKERRNSPSVILWGLQNESVLPKQFAEECSDIIRSLDPTCRDQRAITTCNGGEGTDWNVIQNWSGTYGGSAENYDNELKQPSQLLNGEYGAWRTIDLHGDAKYSEESFTKLLETKARLAESAKDSVCGHFQWIFNSHDNPGRVQPDGALRRIDKIGPINYKGLVTSWEEPTPAYYMYRNRYVAQSGTNKSFPIAADRNVDLVKAAEGYHYFYRINCGGDAFEDEFGQWWQADDTLFSHSWGQDFEGINALQASQRHITNDIRGTKSDELFQFFRFGRHRLWYDLPVPDGEYRVELYFVEPWHGRDGSETSDYEGLRIFDVAINGDTLINDLDPWAEAGYCGAMKRVVNAKSEGGKLHISFPEVKAGQAVICGIAVALKGDSNIPVPDRASTVDWHGLDTDTIAKLPKELLPQDTEERPASVYEPVQKKGKVAASATGTSFIITPGLGQEYALRFRYKNLTGLPVTARMTITDSKNIVLVDRDVTFPPTPNKYKMLSTTTGTQINAGTYTLHIANNEVEFKELEVQ